MIRAVPGSPVISVIIPHLNDPDALTRSLAALAAQNGAPEFEVIVVDNGSRTRPVTALAACPGAALLEEREPGPGPARTTGARAARGQILAFTDSDCIPAPDWCATIAQRFAEPDAPDILAGDVRISWADPDRPTAIEAYESVFGYRQKLYVTRDHFSATCNMAVRASVFARVGPFAGLSVAEDLDWGQRAHAQGFTLAYVAGMRIETPARRTFAELARKWDRQMGHDYAKVKGSLRRRAAWLLRAAIVGASPLPDTVTIARSDRLTGAGARVRAMLGTARIRLYRARRMVELAAGRDPEKLAARWRGA